MIKPYYQTELGVFYCGDAIKVMQGMEGDSVDGCVCDPPYGLEFMGKEWDRFKNTGKFSGGGGKEVTIGNWNNQPSFYNKDLQELLAYQHWTTQWATELYRILKPGAYLLAFGGTRTVHRLTCGIEDAGFIVRDKIAWVYGSGFPKNYDVSKGFDKQMNPEQIIIFDKIRDKLNYYKDIKKLSLQQINQYFGFATNGSGMAGHWFANITQQTLPNKNQYFKLKELLEFDNELDYLFLNLKKGTDRPIISKHPNPAGTKGNTFPLKQECNITAPATLLAQQWSGFGTALKPAHEDIIIAQKPLDKNYCYNLEKWGCGAMNIERGRIGLGKEKQPSGSGNITKNSCSDIMTRAKGKKDKNITSKQGRWPANLMLECCCDEVVEGKQRPERVGKKGGNKGALGAFAGSTSEAIGKWPADKQIIHTNPDCPCYMLDEESGELTSGDVKTYKRKTRHLTTYAGPQPEFNTWERLGDSGKASRFFRYIPKASRNEREAGLKGRLPCVKCGEVNSDYHINYRMGYFKWAFGIEIMLVMPYKISCIRNDHPTVKPIRLFQELQGIFTPPGGITIDPFAGSGSSCISAIREGLRFIAIDQDSHYCDISKARVQAELEKGNQGKLFR